MKKKKKNIKIIEKKIVLLLVIYFICIYLKSDIPNNNMKSPLTAQISEEKPFIITSLDNNNNFYKNNQIQIHFLFYNCNSTAFQIRINGIVKDIHTIPNIKGDFYKYSKTFIFRNPQSYTIEICIFDSYHRAFWQNSNLLYNKMQTINIETKSYFIEILFFIGIVSLIAFPQYFQKYKNNNVDLKFNKILNNNDKDFDLFDQEREFQILSEKEEYSIKKFVIQRYKDMDLDVNTLNKHKFIKSIKIPRKY